MRRALWINLSSDILFHFSRKFKQYSGISPKELGCVEWIGSYDKAKTLFFLQEDFQVNDVEQPLWDALCPEWKIVKAPEPPLKLLLQVAGKTVFKVGETIPFELSLLLNGAPKAGAKVKYRISNEEDGTVEGDVISGRTPAKLSTGLTRPGFALLTATYEDLSGACGAAVEPERIEASPEIKGFDEFWTAQKELLRKTPLRVLSKKRIPPELQEFEGSVEVFDVQVACAGAAPMSGILAMPKNARPHAHPAYLFFHGAGVRAAFQPLTWAAKGMLALNVNAHGLENDKPASYYKNLENGALKDYSGRIVDSPEQSPFRNMALRAVRSVEYMKTLPEWDGRNIIVHGGSQGGWQALVAAALDKEVSFSVAAAPAMCNQAGALTGRATSWPGIINGPASDPRGLRVAPFFDGVAFSRRIACKTLFSVGFSDQAATPSSVYAAFNACGGNATMIDFPECGHAGAVFWMGESKILHYAPS